MTRLRFSIALGWLGCVASSTGLAQTYLLARSLPPAGPVSVYFGSAKSSSGERLTGVVVNLTVGLTTYVAVTDETGRFRVELPDSVSPIQVAVTCSKPGYMLRSADKRTAPSKSALTVQADCVLQRPRGAPK